MLQLRLAGKVCSINQSINDTLDSWMSTAIFSAPSTTSFIDSFSFHRASWQDSEGYPTLCLSRQPDITFPHTTAAPPDWAGLRRRILTDPTSHQNTRPNDAGPILHTNNITTRKPSKCRQVANNPIPSFPLLFTPVTEIMRKNHRPNGLLKNYIHFFSSA